MKDVARLFKLLSDETRLRVLMLLSREELFVCQLMAVLGISQPLVSRNLALLSAAGLLGERRAGKQVFYSLKRQLPSPVKRIVHVLRDELRDDPVYTEDLRTLKECRAFQEKTGRCDMKAFLEFMEQKRKRRSA